MVLQVNARPGLWFVLPRESSKGTALQFPFCCLFHTRFHDRLVCRFIAFYFTIETLFDVCSRRNLSRRVHSVFFFLFSFFICRQSLFIFQIIFQITLLKYKKLKYSTTILGSIKLILKSLNQCLVIFNVKL